MVIKILSAINLFCQLVWQICFPIYRYKKGMRTRGDDTYVTGTLGFVIISYSLFMIHMLLQK